MIAQNEIIEMAKLAKIGSTAWFGFVIYNTASLKNLEAFAKLVADKAFENGFYAGFEASGEGWNSEYPFGDKGIDIRKDESIQYALKEARGEAT